MISMKLGAKELVEQHVAVRIANLRHGAETISATISSPTMGGRSINIGGGAWLHLSWDPEPLEIVYDDGRIYGRTVVRTKVALDYTPCHFGGERPWFVCPGRCARLAGVLYLISRGFVCRRCAGLGYDTQTRQPWERSALKAQRLRRRLGADPGLTHSLPPRPRGMHRRTYERLLAALGQSEQTVLAGMAQTLGRVQADLDRHR
jgi:hypothetical protein